MRGKPGRSRAVINVGYSECLNTPLKLVADLVTDSVGSGKTTVLQREIARQGLVQSEDEPLVGPSHQCQDRVGFAFQVELIGREFSDPLGLPVTVITARLTLHELPATPVLHLPCGGQIRTQAGEAGSRLLQCRRG